MNTGRTWTNDGKRRQARTLLQLHFVRTRLLAYQKCLSFCFEARSSYHLRRGDDALGNHNKTAIFFPQDQSQNAYLPADDPLAQTLVRFL